MTVGNNSKFTETFHFKHSNVILAKWLFFLLSVTKTKYAKIYTTLGSSYFGKNELKRLIYLHLYAYAPFFLVSSPLLSFLLSFFILF